MRKTLIYILLFIFLTAQLQAHRVILKSGEQVSGDLKETEGTSDHIIISTEGEDIKIFKKDIAELFLKKREIIFVYILKNNRNRNVISNLSGSTLTHFITSMKTTAISELPLKIWNRSVLRNRLREF